MVHDVNALDALFRGACVNPQASRLLNLKVVARGTSDFFTELLPFLLEISGAGESIQARIPEVDAPGYLRLTQFDCLRILADAFLCRFRDRPSSNCMSDPRRASINFDELYDGPGLQSVSRAKLSMLLEYFRRMRERLLSGDPLDRPILFSRRQAPSVREEEWRSSDALLLAPVIEPLWRSIDDAGSALRIDFANRVVGGAVIAYGSAQEEIMFCRNPELIAARLFFPALRDDEALLFRGTECFSTATGYGGDLGFGGRFDDRSPIDEDGFLESWILAADALDLRGADDAAQYGPDAMLRELGKLWAGLHPGDGPSEVATGHWGCGIFGGDPKLKFLLQWAACSRAGKTMRYFPWDDESFASMIHEYVAEVRDETPAVGQLMTRLLDSGFSR